MNREEMVRYFKNNMPEFHGSKTDIEKRKAMYVYIELGKMKSFDEKYYLGNSKTKEKIERLVSKNKNNLDILAKNKKIVCASLTYLYVGILNDLGICTCHSVPESDSLDKHIYPIVSFSDGTRIKADLQQDLCNIQTRSKTQNFGQGEDTNLYGSINLSEEEIIKIQKELNYIKNENEYRDNKINEVKNEVIGLNPEDALEKILNDKRIYELDKPMEHMEMYQYYKSVVKKILSEEDNSKIYSLHCYRKNKKTDEKEYTMCMYSIYKEKVKAYIHSEKFNRFIPISLDKLQELESNGLHLGVTDKDSGVRLLRKTIKNNKQKTEDMRGVQ